MKDRFIVAFNKAYTGRKLSRKDKKLLFGKVPTKKQFKNMYNNLVFENDILINGEFCPKCGCRHMRGTGNMTTYPEHYENFYCLRCSLFVGTIDNSRFYHILEHDEAVRK